jgi:hypothetical protein
VQVKRVDVEGGDHIGPLQLDWTRKDYFFIDGKFALEAYGEGKLGAVVVAFEKKD